jgi:hypothetical protein
LRKKLTSKCLLESYHHHRPCYHGCFSPLIHNYWTWFLQITCNILEIKNNGIKLWFHFFFTFCRSYNFRGKKFSSTYSSMSCTIVIYNRPMSLPKSCIHYDLFSHYKHNKQSIMYIFCQYISHPQFGIWKMLDVSGHISWSSA